MGTSAVTLLNPVPVITGMSPTSTPVGAFSLTVSGSNFVSGAQVMFGGTALTTTFVSATQLTATGTATTGEVGSVSVTVDNPNPGAIASSGSETDTLPGTVHFWPDARADYASGGKRIFEFLDKPVCILGVHVS
jgi:hypothetical protein